MIRVNDKEVEWKEGMTILDVLKNMPFDYPQYIVSVDNQRIPLDKHDSYCLEDHSKIRVLYICHGG